MAGTLVIMGPFYIVWNLFTPGGYRSYPLSVLYIKICTLWMGLRIRASGRENLPHSGTCILMPNHRSWWDIPTVQIGAYPHQVRFVAKKELGKIPLLGTCMTGGGHVLIDRGDRDSAVRTLRDAAARYKGRISLVLFPEGTRSPGHHLLRFKRGGFHLARELGLSIVPVSVAGGERIMKKGSFTILPGTMRVHYHAPIPVPKDADLNVISAAVREKIAAGLREMGEYEEEPRSLPEVPGERATHETLRTLALGLILHLALASPVAAQQRNSLQDLVRFQLSSEFIEQRVSSILADSLKLEAADVIRLDPAARHLLPGGRGELGFVTVAKDEPLRAPDLLRGLGAMILERSDHTDGSLAELAARLQDHPVNDHTIALLSDSAWTRAARPAALADAISIFYGGGKRLSGNQRDELRRSIPQVPPGIAGIAAYLLYLHEEVLRLHERAFGRAKLSRGRLDRKNFDLDAMAWVDTLGEVPDRVEDVLLQAEVDIDWAALNAAAVLLDRGAGEAADRLASLPPHEASWTGRFGWDSPAGRIALGGAGADDYRGPHLLIVDTGGNDSYTGTGGARFPVHPVSILLDRTGNDRYAPADSAGPGVGGALGALAVVVDLEGDDTWTSWRLGLGAALFGAGLVYDRSGNDTYESFDFSQGAAAWGLGVLNDQTGNDRYLIRRAGQGFGGPGGVGILIDAGRADADSGDVYAVHPVGSRLTQGVGMGIQRSAAGAPRLAGGMGLLLDGCGNDHYTAESRALGAATLDGLGGLLDWAGDDVYRARSTGCLGFGERGGVGLIIEWEGSDTYDAAGGALGIGIDAGIGIAFDRNGNDSYTAAMLALGSSLPYSIGIFLEGEGSDTYRQKPDSPPEDLGWRRETQLGQLLRGAGLFLDLGGDDVYDKLQTHRGSLGQPGDRRRWGNADAELRRLTTISIGLDVNGLPPE
jgi:1-acyl-sn-glycerol-3-phosphate acyltransferase